MPLKERFQTEKFMKLGPKQKEWIRLLRSGEIKQGIGALKMGTSYCCLGVCKEFVLGEEPAPGQDVLSETDRKKIGLREVNGAACEASDYLKITNFVKENGYSAFGSTILAELNDEGATFQQIADLLEKFPEAFFEREM